MRVAGFVAVAVIACATAPAHATSYSIAAATCSYADWNNTGFSGGTWLDVYYYTSGAFSQRGVHDMSGGISTWRMFCPVDVADGSTFNRISIIAYDYGPRAVQASFYRQGNSTTGATTYRGRASSVDSASVQRQDANLVGLETIENVNYSYFVEVEFDNPGSTQGAGAWLFDILLWQQAAEGEEPTVDARCVDPSLSRSVDAVAGAPGLSGGGRA